MFGLFSPKNDEVLTLEGKATILAPAGLIFALVDFTSPANRLAARGFHFSEKAERLGRFLATDPNLSDLQFEFDVDLYEQDKAYGFNSRIIADPPFGAFERNREEYHIAPIEDGVCSVTLKTTGWYREDVKGRRRRNEEALMTRAVMQDLAKLKIEAEVLAGQRAA